MDYEPNAEGILVPVKAEKPTYSEIASTRDGRDITRGFVDALPLLSPQDPVLASRSLDYRAYEELLRDDQVGPCLRQLRLEVAGAEWHVEAGGDKPLDLEAAEELERQLKAIEWDRATDKMLFGLFYGFAVAEMMWVREGDRVVMAGIKVRRQRRFGFGPSGELKLKTSQSPLGELVPPRRFWHFSTGGDNDDEPYGLGLAHELYWPVWFKRNGVKFWAIFLEKYGAPTAVGKFPRGASADEQKKLLAAVQAVQMDTGIIIPDGMVMELLEATRSSQGNQDKWVEHWDKRIATVILGQTATTQGTPGRLGNDDVQEDVLAKLVKAASDLVCGSFNRGPAKWLTEWNFPGAATPRVWRDVEPDEDLNRRAERDGMIATQLGYRPTLKAIQEIYPGEWEPAPRAAAPAFGSAPGLGGLPEFAEGDSPRGENAVDALIQVVQAIENNTLQQQMEQLATPLMEVAKRGPKAVLDQLGQLYPKMEDAALAEMLARVIFVADVWGRLNA